MWIYKRIDSGSDPSWDWVEATPRSFGGTGHSYYIRHKISKFISLHISPDVGGNGYRESFLEINTNDL